MYGSVFWELDLFVRLSLLKITGNLVETFHSMLVSVGKALLILIIINFFTKTWSNLNIIMTVWNLYCVAGRMRIG